MPDGRLYVIIYIVFDEVRNLHQPNINRWKDIMRVEISFVLEILNSSFFMQQLTILFPKWRTVPLAKSFGKFPSFYNLLTRVDIFSFLFFAPYNLKRSQVSHLLETWSSHPPNWRPSPSNITTIRADAVQHAALHAVRYAIGVIRFQYLSQLKKININGAGETCFPHKEYYKLIFVIGGKYYNELSVIV